MVDVCMLHTVVMYGGHMYMYALCGSCLFYYAGAHSQVLFVHRPDSDGTGGGGVKRPGLPL